MKSRNQDPAIILKWAALLLFFILIFAFSQMEAQQIITFPDGNLRSSIMHANQLGEPYKGQDNGALLVPGTDDIDFTKLNSFNEPAPAKKGVFSVKLLYMSQCFEKR